MHTHFFSSKISQMLTGLILCLFIISVSVTLTLHFRPLYYADIQLLHISEDSGLDAQTIQDNYDTLIDYNSIFNHAPLVFPDFPMSEGGRIHFEEVKNIFDFFGWMSIITLILVIAAIYITKRTHQFHWIGLGGLLAIILPIILGVLVFFNWDYVFVTFHELVFSNDYWLFDERTDPVITILPDTFFMHCAIMIFALVIIGSLVCLCLYRHLVKKSVNY